MTDCTKCYLDIHAGDQQAYNEDLRAYEHVQRWLTRNAAAYGLPAELSALDEAAREVVKSVYESTEKTRICSFDPPASLALPRLTLLVSTSKGVQKTSQNFLDLCSDARKLVSKQKPNPPLRYAGTKLFRIEKDFVVQGGDVTRNDGSGGESIYGGSFNDEKEGLKQEFSFGSLAMANSGKNSNTSQFFICLCGDPARPKKLNGKHVIFGRVDIDDADSLACLDRLNALGDSTGKPTETVWIESCGLLT